MEENSSVEVSEESRRSSRISFETLHPVSHMLDSYIVPVVFDKEDKRQKVKADVANEGILCSWLNGYHMEVKCLCSSQLALGRGDRRRLTMVYSCSPEAL